MEHIVLAKNIVDNKRLAFTSLSCHSHSRVCLVGWCKVKVGCVDVNVLCSQGKVEALCRIVKQGYILVAVTVLKILDNSLAHYATLRVDGQLQVFVLQHNVGSVALQSCMKQSCSVCLSGCLGLCNLLLCCQFCSIFGILACHVLDRVLVFLCSNLFVRRLIPNTKTNQYRGNKRKADDVVFVHFFLICYLLVI